MATQLVVFRGGDAAANGGPNTTEYPAGSLIVGGSFSSNAGPFSLYSGLFGQFASVVTPGL